MIKITALLLIMMLSFSSDSNNSVKSLDTDISAESAEIISACTFQGMEALVTDDGPKYSLVNAYFIPFGGVYCVDDCDLLLCCQVRIIINPKDDLEDN